MTQDIYIHSEDIEFVRLLLGNQEGITPYQLHQKFKLSVGQVSRLLRKYSELKVITKVNDAFRLTKQGQNWILNNRKTLFKVRENKPWRTIPEEFLEEKCEADAQYIPELSEVKKLLHKI